MAHELSLTCARFDHMSPTAAAMAVLLHAVVIVALLAAPTRHAERPLDVVEVTMERELAPEPEPVPAPVPDPAPTPAPAPQPPPPAPPVQQPQPPRLGLNAPIGTTMDPHAPLTAPEVGAAEPEPSARAPEGQEPTKTQEATEEPHPEPPKEIVKVDPPGETVKSEPAEEQQEAALAPQPPLPTPAPSKLEDAVPPVEAPPPPLSSREIPALAPPPPPPPIKAQPQPAPKPQAPPPPAPRAETPQRQLAPSPLSNPPQPRQRNRGDSQQASRATPSPFVNPADIYGERKAKEDYLWGVVRKISRHRYYPKSARENREEGTVVTLVTIARDGRLLGASISRSSGSRTLDEALLEIIQQAAPYAPLPNDISGQRHTFLLPLNFKRTDPR